MTTTGRVVPYMTEMFRFQAWVSLGKMASPVSGEVERDLQAARAAIDLLAELETKTEGNRSPEETRGLQGALTELRLNYLDEMKKGDGPAKTPNPEEPAAEADAEAATPEEKA